MTVRLAKVSVALAAPALFRVMVLPPQVEVRAPNWRAEAAAPFAVKVKFPLRSSIVRTVPPMRVVAVPVSSTFSRPLFWTVMAPAVPVRAPAPLILRVPWVTIGVAVLENVPVMFRVPVPTLVKAEVSLLKPAMLMTPVPTALKNGLLATVVNADAPKFRVAPLATP